MAVSRKQRMLLVVLVTIALADRSTGFLWGNSEESAEEETSQETSEEIWDRLESEENAVSSKVKEIKEKTAKIGTEDLVAMDKDLDADIERDAYEIAKKAAEKVDDVAESAEEEEEEAEEEIDSVMDRLIGDDKKVPSEETKDSPKEKEEEKVVVVEGAGKKEEPEETKGKVLAAEPGMQGDQAQGDRRYYPHNSRSYTPMGSGLATTNEKYFDIRPLENYMGTCENCYEHVGNNICPMHQPALELKKWALELEEVLSHGCMKPENCDKPGTCCLKRMDPFEPTIVRMTQMLKDTFMTVQKNCDKCRVVEWSAWESWSLCSVTCGVGSQMRSRSCDSSSNRRNNCDGPSTENRQCFNQPCCGDSQWSEWCAWSECSGQCGGKKTRTRSCIAQRGCPADDCDGNKIEEIPCGPAVIDGNWGMWAPWVMSGTCGRVSKTRSRLCNNPAPNECGVSCPGRADDTDYEELQPCSCRSTRFSMWSTWGGCSVTCGSGMQTRQRGCEEYTVNLIAGRSCPAEECQAIMPGRWTRNDPLYEETKTCSMQPCCGDWQWSSWTVGGCDATCGVATRSKTRICENVRPGAYCPNEPFQCDRNRSPMTSNEQCPFVECPKPCIEREWTMWGRWSRCPVTCGGAEQERTRTCEIVAGERECPSSPRSRCNGLARDTRQCGATPCPTCSVTQWASWNSWSQCTKTCDGGTQERTRVCRTIRAGIDCPSRGDTPIQCNPQSGPDRQMRSCNDEPCRTCRETQWTSWQRWSSCNCDTLKKTRSRTCQIVVEGVDCPNRGPQCDPDRNRGLEVQDQDCRDPSCCEQKRWDTWSTWSQCPLTCRDQFTRQPAMQTRTRQCRTIKQGLDCGGNDCSGRDREDKDCSRNLPQCEPCQVSTWSDWSRWGRCDCDTKTQSRNRQCEIISPGRDGYECRASMSCDPRYDRDPRDLTQTQPCDDPRCCVDATWTSWSSWTTCEHRCGEEEVTRGRLCDRSRKTDCGRDCVGPLEEKKMIRCGPPAVYGRFGQWEAWGVCSATCGVGDRQRRRRCSVTDDEIIRNQCARGCAGNALEQERCDAGPCCGTTAWSTWTEWSQCSSTCDEGIRERTSACYRLTHGKDCTNMGWDKLLECRLTDPVKRESRRCSYNIPCKPLGQRGQGCEVKAWETWETWTQCTESCIVRGEPNRGTRTRSRLCRTVLQGKKCRADSEMCPGEPEEQVPCIGLPYCPERDPPPQYGPWEDWCPCDCKTGKESRRRSCYRVDPTTRQPTFEVDLNLCQNLGVPREERDCDISRASCPACKTSCRDSRGNPLRDGDYPSCSSCANYISCVDGRAQEFKCNQNGQVLEWDSYVRKCVPPPSASCSLHEPVSDCRDKADGSKYHSARGCSWYVECYQGRPRERECRDGREFDAHTKKCKVGMSWTCVRPFINYNRAVIGGRRVDITPNDAPATMFYQGSLNSTERRLAYEKKMKEKHDDGHPAYHWEKTKDHGWELMQDQGKAGIPRLPQNTTKSDQELTAAKNAERVRQGLDPAPVTKTPAADLKEKFVRRVNVECVSDCSDRPAGHYGSCRACNAYVICTKHGHLRERRCHGGKEFDVAKRKCVTSSQTCVLKGVLTDGA